MAYIAEKLAIIFSCTVSNFMAINREILFKQCRKQNPLRVSELATHIFKYILSKDFEPQLIKFNLT